MHPYIQTITMPLRQFVLVRSVGIYEQEDEKISERKLEAALET
jgi:hypothetical protein